MTTTIDDKMNQLNYCMERLEGLIQRVAQPPIMINSSSAQVAAVDNAMQPVGQGRVLEGYGE